MRFDVLTLFPELIQSHLDFSIMKRASEDGVIEVNTVNPRDYTLDKHKKVDDTPYGGGAGMVLAPQPYVDAYENVNKLENSITIMMTPQGEPFTHEISKELAAAIENAGVKYIMSGYCGVAVYSPSRSVLLYEN